MVVMVTFGIIIVMMVAGPALEPVVDVVETNEEVQAHGWDEIPGEIHSVIMKWVPMIGIAGIILWAIRWYLRRERFSEVRP